MRNVLLGIFFLILHLPLYPQIHIGTAASYGTELAQWGGQLQLGYQWQHWGVRASYIAYFKEEVTVKPSAYNVDAIYQFPSSLAMVPYLFSGISILKNETRESVDQISQTTDGGFNLGAGTYWNFRRVKPFTEFKFVTGPDHQWFLTGGIMYQITSR